ncbi:FBXL4 [Lepeophtheirus salmonis]|uniref:FBXL4 n=1 Tax=Lepeophtheirus salmonis TaxID=72036 RepID=A0A817FF72_LEPSM|nr:FBXL4 [Lepeophtheirus salmonis]CAG9477457.1 FBXL4 [Lepeophtheirus salmonis]
MVSSKESTILSGVEVDNEQSKATEASKTGHWSAVSEMAYVWQRNCLSLRNGILLWGIPLVVPTSVLIKASTVFMIDPTIISDGVCSSVREEHISTVAKTATLTVQQHLGWCPSLEIGGVSSSLLRPINDENTFPEILDRKTVYCLIVQQVDLFLVSSCLSLLSTHHRFVPTHVPCLLSIEITMADMFLAFQENSFTGDELD